MPNTESKIVYSNSGYGGPEFSTMTVAHGIVVSDTLCFTVSQEGKVAGIILSIEQIRHLYEELGKKIANSNSPSLVSGSLYPGR